MLTISMPVMLHSNAKDLEAVHSDGRCLDSLLALQNHVNWSGKETNKCISFACCEKDLGELELKNLAHNFQSSLKLCSRIPSRILILCSPLLSLSASSSSRCC